MPAAQGKCVNTCLLSRVAFTKNSMSLMKYWKYFEGHQALCHLVLIHIVIFLTVALLMLTDMFGIQNFQTDFSCKALVYLYRVMRGLSIGTTCLLSMLQVITCIRGNPRNFTAPASPRVSSEKRATQAILLVSFFVVMY
ncbi:LOW QUALITY PROTEIN: olfactory receptor class A-like protein 1 [Eschrichtius robustus]|uniref:LOW QUALITY PROTEIN: olfactory receptor class A-like protein 1 n=1 Tax=Eschrichtius robustus TaxID=9764 RepID=UPI0035C069A6